MTTQSATSVASRGEADTALPGRMSDDLWTRHPANNAMEANNAMRIVEIRQPLTVTMVCRHGWYDAGVVGLPAVCGTGVSPVGAIEALRHKMFAAFAVMPGLSSDFPAEDSVALPCYFMTSIAMAWRVVVWQSDDLVEASVVGLPDCEYFSSVDADDRGRAWQAALDGVMRLLALRFGTMPVAGELHDFPE